MADASRREFEQLFRGWSRRVRWGCALRWIMTGACAGALSGALLTALLWALGYGEWRLYSVLALLLGALAGGVVALRRRWSDVEVALFLDARWSTQEVVTTAVTSGEQAGAALENARLRAQQSLSSGDKQQVRVRWLFPWHALLPVSLALTGWLVWLPVPPAPASTPQAPGTKAVQRRDVPGLDRIEALEHAPGLTPEDSERLRALAQEAKRLRADLARGLEQREAQSRVAKLRDDIAAERQRFGDKGERPGLDAALSELSSRQATERAARALGEGDLVHFDQEMQRLANQAESRSREQAREALDEAARAAKAKGSRRLSEFLERQKAAFAEREARARALAELSEQLKNKLSPEAQRDLEEFSESGSPEAQQRLAEALGEALEKLSEEERQRIAEQLKQSLEGDGGNLTPMSREQLEALAEQLQTEAGRRALSEQLKELGRTRNPDAERERALEDAERGGAEAGRGLGMVPVPTPGNGTGNSPSPQGGPGTSPGAPGSGPSGGGAEKKKDSESSTPAVEAEELRAKAQARTLPGAPLGTRSMGRAPARAGETANQVGSGALDSVGPAEVGAIEGSDVPEEYREHVGRYFQP